MKRGKIVFVVLQAAGGTTKTGSPGVLAVDAASYDIRLRSTEIKMFSDNVCRLQLFRCCLVVTVPIHVCRRRVVTLLQYQFITEIKMFSDNVTVPIVTVYNVCFYMLIQYQFTCLSLLQCCTKARKTVLRASFHSTIHLSA